MFSSGSDTPERNPSEAAITEPSRKAIEPSLRRVESNEFRRLSARVEVASQPRYSKRPLLPGDAGAAVASRSLPRSLAFPDALLVSPEDLSDCDPEDEPGPPDAGAEVETPSSLPPFASPFPVRAVAPAAPFLPFHFQGIVVELPRRRVRGAALEARGQAAVAKQPLHVFLGGGSPERSLLNLFRERAARRRASGVPNLRARRLVCLRAIGSAAPALAAN